MISSEFIITSLIVVLIPGTGVIYTLSTGLFLGRKASMFAALGCTLGIVPHLLATILGLATILHLSAVAFQTVKFIGVVYLLYLAWSMWRNTGSIDLQADNNQFDSLGIIIKGFLINILNPKLSLFFLAFLPQFIPPNTESPILGMLLLSGIFMGMTLFVFILYGLLADSISTHVKRSPGYIAAAKRSFAAIFALLGVKLALSER